MKKVLLVDDDPVVLKVYEEGLSRHGVQVEIAANGASAVNSLRAAKPDLIVLDLMMPALTGVDVLKFIRRDANLKSLPVLLLSNSYMNGLATEASALGVQKTLLKVRCSPSILLAAIEEVLARQPGAKDGSQAPPVPRHSPPAPPVSGRSSASTSTAPAPAHRAASSPTAEFHTDPRRAFLRDAPAICAGLRGLCKGVITAAGETGRGLRLQGLYREVHSIAATAGMAECYQLAQVASVFEAMLFELLRNPEIFNPSVLRTIASTVDLIALLFDCSHDAELDVPLSANALVVDDDPVSNHSIESALAAAQVKAVSISDSRLALQRLEESHYDLVLLDVEMPNLDGFELCRRLRKLPGYQQTAVIYITAHTDVGTRAQSIRSGGDDFICKPVFPLELTVKAVALLLKPRNKA